MTPGGGPRCGPCSLTRDVSAHGGQRRQVGGAEGREPARVHFGHPVAPKQLILEEQADLRDGRGPQLSTGEPGPPPSFPSPSRQPPPHSGAVPGAGALNGTREAPPHSGPASQGSSPPLRCEGESGKCLCANTRQSKVQRDQRGVPKPHLEWPVSMEAHARSRVCDVDGHTHHALGTGQVRQMHITHTQSPGKPSAPPAPGVWRGMRAQAPAACCFPIFSMVRV